MKGEKQLGIDAMRILVPCMYYIPPAHANKSLFPELARAHVPLKQVAYLVDFPRA